MLFLYLLIFQDISQVLCFQFLCHFNTSSYEMCQVYNGNDMSQQNHLNISDNYINTLIRNIYSDMIIGILGPLS